MGFVCNLCFNRVCVAFVARFDGSETAETSAAVRYSFVPRSVVVALVDTHPTKLCDFSVDE